jgi:hypothetical protein
VGRHTPSPNSLTLSVSTCRATDRQPEMETLRREIITVGIHRESLTNQLLKEPIPSVERNTNTPERHKIGLSRYYEKKETQSDASPEDYIKPLMKSLRDQAVAHKRKAQEFSKDTDRLARKSEALHYLASVVLFVQDWLRLPSEASGQAQSLASLKLYLSWVCKHMPGLGQDGLTSLCFKLDAIMLLRAIPARSHIFLRELNKGTGDASAYASETIKDFTTADNRWKESVKVCPDLATDCPATTMSQRHHFHPLADIRTFCIVVTDCISEWTKLHDLPFDW